MQKNNIEISVEAYEILLKESSNLGVSISELLLMRAKCNTPDIFLPKSVIHPARLLQKEAMQYVNIGTWDSFENWIEKNGVAFSYNGNRKLFRKAELDRAILLDEERAKLLLNQ